MKICTKCKNTKELNDFTADKQKSDGHYSSCKSCNKKRIKDYHITNEVDIAIYKKTYYLDNIEDMKKWRAKNYVDNKEKIITRVSKYNKVYVKARKEYDSLFKLRLNIRSLVANSFASRKYTKKSKTFALVGCDVEFLNKHLESTAEQNYGPNWRDLGPMEIDHIFPCSLAHDEEHLIRLQHYTNLQYLTPRDNLLKSDKLGFRINNTEINL